MLYCTGTTVQYNIFAFWKGQKICNICSIDVSFLDEIKSSVLFWMECARNFTGSKKKDLMETMILHSMKIGKICRSIRKVVFML
ncbi:hypothetical protein L1887_32884 [Cichorium endivia]|nr:hypothetical protein L1887_32884 [Cichorium endivia]